MDDKKRSNDELVDEILQEAHALRNRAAQKAASSNSPIKEPDMPSPASGEPVPPPPAREEPSSPGKDAPWKKLFGHRPKRFREESADEAEDVYYGMPLKPIEEYQQGFDDTAKQQSAAPLENNPTAPYSFLFDDAPESDLDEEIASRFRELHDERRRKAQEAMSAGPKATPTVEFGVVRPLPKKTGIDHDKEIFSVSPGAQVHMEPTSPTTETAASDFPIETSPSIPPEKPEPSSNQAAIPPESPPSESEFSVEDILEEVRNREHDSVPTQNPTETKSESETKPISIETEAPASQTVDESPDLQSDSPAEEPSPSPKEIDVSEKAKAEVPSSAQPEKNEDVPENEKEPAPEPELKVLPLPVKKEPPRKPPVTPPQPKKFSGSEDESQNPFVDETPRRPKMPQKAREGPSYAPHLKPVHLMDLDVLDFALREESRYYEEQMRKKEEAEAERRKKHSLKMKRKKALQKGFALKGEEPQEESAQEVQTPEEELDDFNAPSDAPSVSHDLRASMRELMLRVLVTGLCTGLLGLFGLIGEFQGLFGWQFSKEAAAITYMVLNLIFLLICMGVCFRMILSGLKSLLRFQATSDSGLALAAVAALMQSVYACFCPDEIMSGSLHLYSVLASGALFLNAVGKLVMIRRIWINFRFVSSRETKYAVQLYDDYNTSLKLAKDCVLDSPAIAYQQKTGFLSRFLQNSYEADPLETGSQTLAPIGFIASLALCIAVLIISHSASEALSAFTASACICVPFTGLLGGNLLLRRLAVLGKKFGSMAIGYPAVDKFSSVNAVMLDARDLFPKGTILLSGIKTFGNQRIDEAIMEATALMCAAGGPLVSVFDQIIKTRREILPRVDKPIYEDGRGVTGWVAGHRVLIGNRDLLVAHHIDPPSHEDEGKLTAGGKKAAYLAIGGQLVAMFILTYRADPHRSRELQRMEINGISLIIRTCDPNITESFVASAFGLDPHSVRVLPDSLGSEFVRVTEKQSDRTPALLATRGRSVSMIRMLCACIRTRSNLTLAAVMQSVSVILGFVLVAFLACYSGLQQLSTLSLILYEAFWVLVILFFPRLHKP